MRGLTLRQRRGAHAHLLTSPMYLLMMVTTGTQTNAVSGGAPPPPLHPPQPGAEITPFRCAGRSEKKNRKRWCKKTGSIKQNLAMAN